MKKITSCKWIVSLLLCLLMIFSCAPSFALAEGNLSLTLGEFSQVTMKCDSVVTASFTPEKDGYFRFYSVSEYDPRATLYDSNMEELSSNDDGYIGDNNYDFSLKYKLEAAKTYYLEMEAYESDDITFDVMMEETVGAVSAKLLEAPYEDKVVKGFEAETMSESGAEVEFTLSDGSKEIWYADMENMIAYTEVSYEPLEKIIVGSQEDSKFVLEVTCDDAVLEIPYQVIDNPVKSITYKGEGLSFYQNTHGYFDSWSDDENAAFIYEYSVWEEMILVEYTDGSSEELALSDMFLYTDPTIGDDQSENPWEVGTNEITVSYLGKETTIPVTILPCPFKNATVNSNPTAKYVYGNLENGDVYDDTYYFDVYDLTGLSVTFENTDGTKVTYTANDFDMDWYELDGYGFSLDSGVCQQPGMAECILSYKGMDVPFQVEVVESPIADLEILGNPNKSTYEDVYAPILDGLSVKLTMKDGTSQTVELNQETVEYRMEWNAQYVISVGEYTVYGFSNYDEDDNVYICFYCLDQVVDCKEFTFTPAREVANIEISEFAIDGDGMVLAITYENGDQETIKVKTLCEDEWSFHSDYLGLTENGILEYSIGEDYQDGEEGYSVDVLDQMVFVPFDIPCEMGDLNDDTKVDAKDALQVLKYAVGKTEFTLAQEINADVNIDGDINAKDALEILKFSVNKPSALDPYYAE